MRTLNVLFLPHPNDVLKSWNTEITDLISRTHNLSIFDRSASPGPQFADIEVIVDLGRRDLRLSGQLGSETLTVEIRQKAKNDAEHATWLTVRPKDQELLYSDTRNMRVLFLIACLLRGFV